MAYEEAPAGFRWLLISLLTRAPLQSLTTETLHASPFPQRVLHMSTSRETAPELAAPEDNSASEPGSPEDGN